MHKIKTLITKYTGHATVELTSRGNTAIFAAFYCARKFSLNKKKVLIPDQGGWLTYKKYPKMLELEPVELQTNDGAVDPSALPGLTKDANSIIYQNPAGYFAQQQMDEIYRQSTCTVILDATGSIGSPLCNGSHADIIVGSFGKWKVADAGYGGFISFKDPALRDRAREIFNTTAFDESKADSVYEKLRQAPARFRMLAAKCEKIKEDLSEFNVLHRDSQCACVVVAYANDAEKQKIVQYCERHKYEYTQCPRYIRVMRDAVSIEVKRLR